MNKGIDNNTRKRQILLQYIEETLKQVLAEGFYGEVWFSLSIQDGAIQDVKKHVTQKAR